MKKIADEVMKDEELDSVAGGTIAETAADSFDLYRRGLVEKMYAGSSETRAAINEMGYKYGDHGGLFKPNEYYDKLGKPVSREKLWNDFDKEYQTEAIPVAEIIGEQMALRRGQRVFVGQEIFCMNK